MQTTDENEFQVLDPLDFIKHNSHMYCGSTYNPIHLFKEIIDNPIDLLLENKVSIIVINNFKNGRFSVIDNGPGFPRIQVKLPDGSFQDSIIASLTKPHSGSKFNAKVAQQGQNGVGTMVVNALSSWMIVKVRNFNNITKVFSYIFKDAHFIEIIEEENSEHWSTKVEFEVNPKFFETVEISDEIIIDRLNLVKSRYSKCRIFYNDIEIKHILLKDFAKNKLKIDENTPIFQVDEKDCTVFFTYDVSGVKSPTVFGDINLNICEGPFITSLLTTYFNTVNSYIDNDRITRTDILGHFRAYISLNVLNARFDSQTKIRSVSNVSNIINLLKPKILNLISTSKFFKEFFKILLESKAIQTAAKVLKTKKTRVSSDNPLKDCARVPGKILYLLEGESAEGTLKQIRDIQIEAIFPLTGKILNAIDKSIDKAIESKKIKYLLEAIGVDLTLKNQTAFRYEKVKLLCDGDSVCAETEICYLDKNNENQIEQIKDIDIKNIDLVYSLNKRTLQGEHKKVLRIIKHKYNKKYINRITTEKGRYIDCTDDHVIYVYSKDTFQIEEISPRNISIDKHYLIANNNNSFNQLEVMYRVNNDFIAIKIKSIEQIDYKYEYVYDLEVEDNNNFACTRSGFILHNSDGQHIVVLAAIALWKYCPSLIANNQVSMILPPLYGASKKKEFIPIYNYKDVDIYTQRGYTITRFKGLGEMNPEQLSEVVYNKPIEYIINAPLNAKEGELVVQCLTDTDIKRKVCADSRIGLSTLLKNLSI